MEFNEKLRELRKQKGLTQEELAASLYVSRTAISKWESARGYPNIESLKAIAKLFSVTIDELLSSDELLTLAEEDHREKENRLRDRVFGLLDLSAVLLFFLPMFARKAGETIQIVSLGVLTGIAPYLRIVYFLCVIGIIISGVLMLALQRCRQTVWTKNKSKISFLLNVVGTVLFISGLQPYAATFLFVFLLIKVLMVVKKQ